MKHKIIFLLLIFIGSVRAIADISGFSNVSSFFSLFNVSPAMKVFTAHNNYETFSPKFMLDFQGVDGESISIELTPELYRKLEGPYNRRNVFGAAISYGPVLVSNKETTDLFNNVAHYSFCKPGRLIEELGLDVPNDINKVSVRYIHQQNINNDYPIKLEVECE